MEESLDPRVNRLPSEGSWKEPLAKPRLDQFGTHEVFLKLNDKKPYEHAGIMHAPNAEMALVFAKEQYSRRYTCVGMMVVPTNKVFVTPTTENQESIYDRITGVIQSEERKVYHIFHLKRRGKQHVHVGDVIAGDIDEALVAAKEEFDDGTMIYNIWVVRDEDLLKLEERDIWNTLPEKKFRDAISYKAADKIKKFKEEQAHERAGN